MLPASVAGDAERLARFQREAEVLAALNHPNIAQIYGLEKSNGVIALVMELVEGPTLADLLVARAGSAAPGLPVNEALLIARQIADALEAAHEQGVIHRDLKPANIKVRPDGTVKVLDFGLAKAMEPAGTSNANATMSPTLSIHATQAGMILGTAAYMAPEQAKGKPVDRRADIWAFGVVIYEMITGRMLFAAETASETMAAVMMKEPDWTALPSATPARLRELLRRCVIKEPRNRLQSIGDARIAIDELLTTPGDIATPPVARESRHGRRWMIAAAVCLIAAMGLAVVHFREVPPDAPPVVRFDVAVAASATSGLSFEVSPDGRFMAYWAPGEGGGPVLMVRSLDAGDTREVPDSARTLPGVPFWSHDSRHLFFTSNTGLRRIEATGSSSVVVCDCMPAGGTINQDGVLVLWGLGGERGLLRLAPSGRVPVPLTKSDGSAWRDVYPQFLEDGRRLIYFHESDQDPASSGVYLLSLDDDVPAPQRVFEREAGSGGRMARLSRRGVSFVLIERGDSLVAHPVDWDRGESLGEPVVLMEPVSDFSVSENGVLAYRPLDFVRQVQVPTWFDRQGEQVGIAGDPSAYAAVALSPNGLTLATIPGDGEISLRDLGGRNDTRFVLRPRGGTNGTAIWAPDGSSMVFSSRRDGSKAALYRKAVSGAGPEELLMQSDQDAWVNDWSRDGRYLIFSTGKSGSEMDLQLLPLARDAGGRTPVPYIQSPFTQKQAEFSVDGRYVAYISNESGAFEVWVASFPDPSKGKWLISRNGGVEPRWSPDGKELFYFSGQKLMATTVRTDTTFAWSPPTALFEARVVANYTNDSDRWQVSPDGKRFLLLTSSTENAPSPISVIVNWPGPMPR